MSFGKAATLALAILLFPGLASACAMCFQATSEANRIAFLVTTVLLTFMPLILIGGLIGYFAVTARRRGR